VEKPVIKEDGGAGQGQISIKKDEGRCFDIP
jgi:hypothetical protein